MCYYEENQGKQEVIKNMKKGRKKRRGLLQYYYREVTKALDEFLPYIPVLQLTYAMGYRGRTYSYNRGEVCYKIALSRVRLDMGRNYTKKDIERIVEVICHELAHIFYWEHGEDHKRLTDSFFRLSLFRLGLASVNEYNSGDELIPYLEEVLKKEYIKYEKGCHI